MTSVTPTVSVCIPAYNEEGGIGRLLTEILGQEHRHHRLGEVLVASDGSTDATVAEARLLSDARIRVTDDGERRGKSIRINQLLHAATGDVVVLMDADVVLRDPTFFDRVVRDFDPQRSGIAAPVARPLPATGWVGRSLAVSSAIVREVGAAWRPGEGVYLQFRGCCLVLGRDFARDVQLPPNLVNDDAFLYLQAGELGYRPQALTEATIWYLLPSTIRDHRGQSGRHKLGTAELARWFPAGVVRREYAVPRRLLMRAAAQQAVRRPVGLLGYLVLQVAALHPGGLSGRVARWTPAASTKPKPKPALGGGHLAAAVGPEVQT
jgi:glycosyltransferase involved in cell wall biosynthesis